MKSRTDLARNLLLLLLLACTAVLGWSALRREAPKALPTLAGRPDLNGVWQALSSAQYDLEPHDARAALAMRPGPIVPVPAKEVVRLGAVGAVPAGVGVVDGGAIPYLPWARKRKEENQARWLERDPEIKCYLPGVPRANYMHLPFQILQSESAMLLAYEYAGATRTIHFTDPGPPPVESWMGQSVGRWEGDTLVVSVTSQNGETWLDRSGNFHSDKLRVTERYKLAAPGLIEYEAELVDPEVYTRPWKLRVHLYKRQGPEARLLQFKCVEFVEELLYGHLRKEPLR